MELTPEAAEQLSRKEALKVLATAEGVPARDRRLALLMLAGPAIGSEDQHLLSKRPKRIVLGVAVAIACRQLAAETKAERAADLRMLSGA